jgi:polar amino acid transport system substrate-binding protein
MSRALVIAIALLLPGFARADDRPLVVAVSDFPPTTIHNPDGSWSGICVDAWKQVADSLDLKYTFREVDAKDLMAKGLEQLDVDVVTCLGPNPRTEKMMDVTHPFLISGLAIATRAGSTSGLARIAHEVLSWRFARNFGVLLLIIILVGVVVWRIERKTSPDEFGGPPLKGIGGGIFWTVESLFAKPKPLSRRLRSRLVSLFWVFACMILISGVTAKLAAEFTVNQLEGTVAGIKDLPRVRVGAAVSTTGNKGTAARYLDAHGIPYRAFVADHTSVVMLEALDRGELDAVLAGSLELQHLVNKTYPGRLTVLPDAVQPVMFGFGLRLGSPLRKQIDLALLKLAEAGAFKQIVSQYVGGIGD